MCDTDRLEQFIGLNIQTIQIQKALAQYEQQLDQDNGFEQQTEDRIQDNHQAHQRQQYDIEMKKNIKPLRMFKDLMELTDQNRQKRKKIADLEQHNQRLRKQYQQCIQSNKKVQHFLKKIQCTFKNDQFTQKANKIITQAKKTLYRQAKQSNNCITKITKNPQSSYVQQCKSYMIALLQQKQRLLKHFKLAQQQNAHLRQEQDFNEQHVQKYRNAKQLIQRINAYQARKARFRRNSNIKMKLEVSLKLRSKEIQAQKIENQKCVNNIKDMLLRKEGLQYQRQILRRKKKQRNKIEEQLANFQLEINMKKKNIQKFQKDLKQKIKTYEYMSECAKQWKKKLQDPRQSHSDLKTKHEQRINALSKQFDEWNRKYKFELAQDQSNKKNSLNTEINAKEAEQRVTRKIRVIKIQQIRVITRKIGLYLLVNNLDTIDFIINRLLKKAVLQQNVEKITFSQINYNLKELEFVKQHQSQMQKMARYIVEDNTSDFSRIQSNTKIELKLAKIILKNLLATELKFEDIQHVKDQIKVYINQNFHHMRQQIFMTSGKKEDFDIFILQRMLMRRFQDQRKIFRYKQLFQCIFYAQFNQVIVIKLTSFQTACEIIVQKKLVKANEKNAD